MMRMFTHIGVTADSLDNALIEVPGVTEKASSDVIRMSEAAEDSDGELGSLCQITLGRLDLDVLVLNPVVV